MQVLKLMTFSFWCGWMASVGIRMAGQDWLGLEAYIEWCREHWIDLHWLVGASITLIAIWVYMGRRMRVWTYLMQLDEKAKAKENDDEQAD